MSRTLLTIIDYGMGNLHSVAKALEHVAPNTQIEVTSDKHRIAEADHILLPGVGAIRDCMAEIRRQGVDTVVAEAVNSGKPFLGICVGMQALMAHSHENNGVDCLGHFDGEVRRFSTTATDERGLALKVPHMGWNTVDLQIDHPLLHGINSGDRFYFVHSYYVEAHPEYTAASCTYDATFAAMIYRDNLFATQFHPEKSFPAGLTLLKNFVDWDGRR
ncbi:MAG: imidazole glycerol phosphate synthase subunit HisH [Saccharospirillum sp.]|uniref:imidazole glycerol phosphate synthase subunit HisH n=1 Tax=Saccharospirillum sp. TaxID=2033801 RepID=UPI0034A0229A